MRDVDALEGDPRVKDLFWEALEMHAKKSIDYGVGDDPLANVRASEDFGIPGWIGCLNRMNDKVIRLKNYAKKRFLANESARDSMVDIIVYAAMATVLYDEATAGEKDRITTALENDSEIQEDAASFTKVVKKVRCLAHPDGCPE